MRTDRFHKTLVAVAACCLLTLTTGAAWSQEATTTEALGPPYLSLNGHASPTPSSPPILTAGKLLAPVEDFFDLIGGDLTSDTAAGKYTVTRNGTVIEIRSDGIRCVATDGHRLAYAGASGEVLRSVIVPRKAVIEIARMLDSGNVEISISERAIRVTCGDNVATCRLIDGRFPDYERMVSNQPIVASCNRLELIDGLKRAAVLAHEMSRM